jgi:hypothetical protein
VWCLTCVDVEQDDLDADVGAAHGDAPTVMTVMTVMVIMVMMMVMMTMMMMMVLGQCLKNVRTVLC